MMLTSKTFLNYVMMRFSKYVFSLVLVISCNISFAQLNKDALNSFIQRIVKDHSKSFIIEEIPKQNGKDVFELQSKKGKIILRGSNGVSIASALNFYLKNYCHCSITWNGSNMNLPGSIACS